MILRTKLISVVCTILAAAVLVSAGEKPKGEVVGRKKEKEKTLLAKIKMLESSLQARDIQIKKLQADNVRLAGQVQLLRKLCQAIGLNPNVKSADQTKTTTGGKPAATTQAGVDLTGGSSITIWSPDLPRWQGHYVAFWRLYEEAKKSNPALTRRQYDGARVVVVGEIDSIGRSGSGAPLITLILSEKLRDAMGIGQRSDIFITLQFPRIIQTGQGAGGAPVKVKNQRLATQIGSLKKGDTIAVSGTWHYQDRRVVGCKLVKRRKAATVAPPATSGQ
ncbi:MAG: hypothetical protein QGH60_00505 [Phycisphaerae bacterium]|jgi:hypothetical protein|nr:hypothetical protein [Phycisphaerae bacterium]